MDRKIKKEINKLLNTISYTGGVVDLDAIAKHLGIRVYKDNLPDNVSGVLDCRKAMSPIVLINSTHHTNRQRFSLAHEIGHFVMLQITGVHMDTKVFLRQDTPNPLHARMEREANKFAAELTMPELQVKESWNQISADFLDDNPVAALANQFQVSEGALMIRLKEIKGLNKIW